MTPWASSYVPPHRVYGALWSILSACPPSAERTCFSQVLTGGLVGITLLICKVRLATVFGLLSFILNYIPNVRRPCTLMLTA